MIAFQRWGSLHYGSGELSASLLNGPQRGRGQCVIPATQPARISECNSVSKKRVTSEGPGERAGEKVDTRTDLKTTPFHILTMMNGAVRRRTPLWKIQRITEVKQWITIWSVIISRAARQAPDDEGKQSGNLMMELGSKGRT